MAPHFLEFQLASAVHRFNALERQAEGHREPGPLLQKALAELGTTLEEVRAAQEQLVESNVRIERLQNDLREQATKYSQLFDDIPYPCVVTKPDSTIVEANKAAAELLNVSQRFLVGKTLSIFVCEDRGRFLTETSRVADRDQPHEFQLRIRPRERAPVPIVARVNGSDSTLRWILRHVAQS